MSSCSDTLEATRYAIFFILDIKHALLVVKPDFSKMLQNCNNYVHDCLIMIAVSEDEIKHEFTQIKHKKEWYMNLPKLNIRQSVYRKLLNLEIFCNGRTLCLH